MVINLKSYQLNKYIIEKENIKLDLESICRDKPWNSLHFSVRTSLFIWD